MIKEQDKQNRTGLVILITGNGKGKTTSALGTAIRALGWGWNVQILQFIKSDIATGEKQFAQKCNFPLKLIPMGAGLTWNKNKTTAEHKEMVDKAWQKAKTAINEPNLDLVILDELNIAANKNWLDIDDVIETLQNRPSWKHVIITGRYAPDKLIKFADLVSEIQEIKHPFNAGIYAQKGIDF